MATCPVTLVRSQFFARLYDGGVGVDGMAFDMVWIHPVLLVSPLALLAGAIGRGLGTSLYMFYETFWALTLGFGLSGAVQAFTSRGEMERLLGDHRLPAVLRASVLGAASSSCSYAATAMAKSVFQKGADFVTAMVFMVASTNLVIELGLVLLVLIGWQFTVAEFIGGPIMILLLVVVGGIVFTPALTEAARARLVARAAGPEQESGNRSAASCRVGEGHDLPHDGMQAHGASIGMPSGSGAAGKGASWRDRFLDPARWADAAAYARADVTMLRRELLIGYVVAGFLAALVPVAVWNVLFLKGQGGIAVLENAAIGPVIAMLSWVCSVGNVPLAAALWKGGISFGGVVSFVFADLIAMPMILIYRRFYGWRLTLRILLVFYPAMAVSGLVVGELFTGLGLVPAVTRAGVAAVSYTLNYTAVLNGLFFLVFLVLLWLSFQQARYGGGSGLALDPVCGMQVETAAAPASTVFQGQRYWFCSNRCLDRFVAAPASYAAAMPGQTGNRMSLLRTFPLHAAGDRPAMPSDTTQLPGDPVSPELPASAGLGAPEDAGKRATVAVDPVCGMEVKVEHAAVQRNLDGVNYYFCSTVCAAQFDQQN